MNANDQELERVFLHGILVHGRSRTLEDVEGQVVAGSLRVDLTSAPVAGSVRVTWEEQRNGVRVFFGEWVTLERVLSLLENYVERKQRR